MTRKHVKYIPLWLAALLAAGLLAGCAGKAAESTTAQETPVYDAPAEEMAEMESYDEGGAMPGEAPEAGAGQKGDGLARPSDGRKVILNAWLRMESTEFDKAVARLNEAVARHGGYLSAASVHSAEQYGLRSASFTARIPTERYDAFLGDAGEAATLLSREESSEDVTAAYVDVEARLKALRAQEARLLELMEQAGSLADLLEVQSQLTEVTYEIESYTAQKKTYDDLIETSTVNIELSEVLEATPVQALTFGGRFGQAFVDGWHGFTEGMQGLAIALAYAVPGLIIVLVLVVCGLMIWRRARKRRKARAQAVPGQVAQPAQVAPGQAAPQAGQQAAPQAGEQAGQQGRAGERGDVAGLDGPGGPNEQDTR